MPVKECADKQYAIINNIIPSIINNLDQTIPIMLAGDWNFNSTAYPNNDDRINGYFK